MQTSSRDPAATTSILQSNSDILMIGAVAHSVTKLATNSAGINSGARWATTDRET